MHIVENKAIRAGKTYCYACECLWDANRKKYLKPSVAVGRLEGNPPSFVPNDYLASLLRMNSTDTSSMDERDKRIIDTVIDKYGEGVYDRIQAPKASDIQPHKGHLQGKFNGRYKDVYPALSKTQRGILKALGIRAPG